MNKTDEIKTKQKSLHGWEHRQSKRKQGDEQKGYSQYREGLESFANKPKGLNLKHRFGSPCMHTCENKSLWVNVFTQREDTAGEDFEECQY